MPKTMSPEQKLVYMTETPLPKLVVTLAVPTMISMLISSFYSMIDTYFVGLLDSASATGAVGVIFPLMAIMQAIGFMFGHGSGNYMSRALGTGNTEDAQRMSATGFFSAFFVGIVLMLLGYLLLDPLVFALGSTKTIAPYARQYVFYLLPGAPFLVASLVLNNQLRFQGSAFYSMIGITAGAVLNIALDPLFIFTFGMGVEGAALATSISQAFSFVLLLIGTGRGGNIPMRFKNFIPSFANYREIFRGGVPSLARQGLASLATVCLNVASSGYGDAAIAAMSIVARMMQMAGSMIIGFGQGFQPICGFNYGAKRYDRVRKAFWFCVKIGFVMLLVISGITIIFAPEIIGLFLAKNPEVQAIGAFALRMQCSLLPLFAFVIVANMMLQTIGMVGKATLLAVLRQGLFFIPAVFLLEKCFGLTGVQISQTVSDLLSFIVAVPLTLGVLRELKERDDQLQKESSGSSK